MTASYEVRLLIQCLSVFFLVHLLLSLGVNAVSPLAVSLSERLRPIYGVRLLLFLRLLPILAASYAAAAIALPSYLRLEQESDAERIGFSVLCSAVLAIAIWARPLPRTIKALRHSSQFVEALLSLGRPSSIARNPVWILPEPAPRVAVAGVLRPRVLLSESAIDMFSPEELNLVLLHEKAHQRSRDNLMRLLLLILPDVLPFVRLNRALEAQCKRLVEWAADDFAAAGDRQNSISLARALVCFARHQNRAACCILATSLVEDDSDLARRVDRLLGSVETSPPTVRTYMGSTMLLALVASTFAAAIHFADLSRAHRLLEILSH
ncbi:MAG: hypothetical protein JO051_00430 [Acidobacteriaceae bacterium]|nr:hypothetical protein [Acidobacteriaceae bacterium]